MSKTPFSNKVEILGRTWLFYKDEVNEVDGWREFFSWADVALPMSYMIWQDMVSIKKNNEMPVKFIDEAWSELCAMIGKDADARYDTLEELFGTDKIEGIDIFG